MTQQPFVGRGAIDLSALKRPAPQQAPTGAGGDAKPGAPVSAYAVAVDEQNFQSVLQSSTTAPVVLVFHSPSQAPESSQMADDVADIVGQYDGRFLVGIVDVDAVPQIAQVIAQASQLPQLPVPLLMVFLDGRPAIQPIPGMVSRDELSTLFNELGQQLTAQGITGRHQPLAGAPAESDEDEEDGPDPRYAPAQDALAAGDIDGAVAEYQKLVDSNPADAEAAAGLAMAKVLQRTQGVDLDAARAAAAADPDDVDAQTMVADLDLLGGHVDDAFARLIELVRRTSDKDRDRTREHLLALFAAVGNEDPRVLKGRQALASALF
ncbi:co-chaperone YbbN [Nocardioides bizhenqiangii]|uniref:Tetratricopeptide repeat protein n=1 Tax=Nocardioides bizhenqiangii TaxID=3095076 RepID=A0ABZ0ZWC2_9ACTN|nr:MULTISPECIES: tetratricopeptide repeat protein [unclassified Nocardioides]MDZ5623168.1 tetratricopeptide repeat protein [Nocardioides sp. HM23]WQQ28141.1 tetratricopeptide repeat protein [Nocardioides sp. HM61]